MENAIPPRVAMLAGSPPTSCSTNSVTTGCTACTANCASSNTTNSGTSPGARPSTAKLCKNVVLPTAIFGGVNRSCTNHSTTPAHRKQMIDVSTKGARLLSVTSAMAPPASGPTNVPTSCPVLSHPSA